MTSNLINFPVEIETALFTPIQIDSLAKLAPELTKTYATRQIFRTDTEARVSVLDKIRHPTKASKYWQCVREQSGMLEQLSLASFEYRRNEVAIKRLERTLSTSADELDIEEAQIDLEEKLFTRVTMKTVASDRLRELEMWSQIKSELDDGSFDTENVNTHQLISYTTQYAIMAANTGPGPVGHQEMLNMVGQLNSMIDRCTELGVLDDVVKNLPLEVGNAIKQLQIANK